MIWFSSLWFAILRFRFQFKEKVAIHIINNNCFGVDYDEKYMTICESLKLFFSNFLDRLHHPEATTVVKSKPSIMKLKWGTKNNDVTTVILLKSFYEVALYYVDVF